MCHRRLHVDEAEAVIDVLTKAEYPDVPSLSDLKSFFEAGMVEGIFQQGKLVGVALLGPYKHNPNTAWMDIAVLPEAQGRWGTRSLFKKLFDTAFGRMKAFMVMTVSKVASAQHGLSILGFKPLGQTPDGDTIFILLKSESRFA